MAPNAIRVGVAMACFNRREKTVACLRALFSQCPAEVDLRVHLLDDASSDGTPQAVRALNLPIQLHEGTGRQYWAGGMRTAFGAALAEDHDYYLWLNDDVVLTPGALAEALAHMRSAQDQGDRRFILAGATVDQSGELTYGGYRPEAASRRWNLVPVAPDKVERREITTFNGNFVLISREAAQSLGNIPRAFVHDLADFHYGLQATRRGIVCALLPGVVGTCDRGRSRKVSWQDTRTSVRTRVRKIFHPLGQPLLPWIYFCLTNYPFQAAILIPKPYLRAVFAPPSSDR